VLGYSPLKAGFMTAPVAVGLMVGGPTAPRLVRRFGTKYVVTGGLFLVGACLLTYASDTVMSSLALGGAVRLLFGLGIGLTTAPATESIMGSLPREKAGVGSAVNDTTRQTGGALGVAVLGSIFSANYRSIIDGRLAGVPTAAAEAARDSIGKAVGVLHQVPPGTAQVIRGDADHAYLQSMHVAYPIAAGAVALAAVITLKYLPARPPAAGDGPAESRVGDELAVAVGLEDALPDAPHQAGPAVPSNSPR